MQTSQDSSQDLLTIVGPRITKRSTQMRDTLLAAERLAFTTHFLPSYYFKNLIRTGTPKYT